MKSNNSFFQLNLPNTSYDELNNITIIKPQAMNNAEDLLSVKYKPSQNQNCQKSSKQKFGGFQLSKSQGMRSNLLSTVMEFKSDSDDQFIDDLISI